MGLSAITMVLNCVRDCVRDSKATPQIAHYHTSPLKDFLDLCRGNPDLDSEFARVRVLL